MARYVLGSNFHQANLTGAARSWSSADMATFPPAVTLGFRGVFWSVFTGVHEFEVKEEPILIYDRPCRILKLLALESADATTRLGFSDPRNVFVVFILETLDPTEEVDLNDEMFTRDGASIGVEQQFVQQALNSLRPVTPDEFVPSLVHHRNLPARFIFALDQAVRNESLTASIVAFYFYALLMLWQVEREQVHLPLDTPEDELASATRMLLRQRQKIINVTRLFFTTNVTNNPETQRVRKQVMTRFGLERRFSRLPPIIESIERYYEVRTQALLQHQSEKLNRIAMAIALLGLPISVISMLLAIDTRAEIVNQPVHILGNPIIQTFLVASTLLCLMTMLALVTALAFKLQPLVRRFIRRQKNVKPFGSTPT